MKNLFPAGFNSAFAVTLCSKKAVYLQSKVSTLVALVFTLVLAFGLFGCIQPLQPPASKANQPEFENWLTAATDLNAFNGSIGSSEIITNLLDDATNKFNEDSTKKLLDIWFEINSDTNQKKYNLLVVNRAVYNVNPSVGAKLYTPIIKRVDKEKFSIYLLVPMITLIGKDGSSESISALIWAYKNANSEYYPDKLIFSDGISVTRNPASLKTLYANLLDESQDKGIRYASLLALPNFGPRISLALEAEALNKVSDEQVKNSIVTTMGMTKAALFDILSDECKTVNRADNPTKFFACYDTITASSFTEENCNKQSKPNYVYVCQQEVNLDNNYSNVNVEDILK